ncbi:MAG: ATP-dependent RecD-like DNA helicase [Chlamydiia bacterium]|nr:ATP-dependent RecD-like DNA helicase [Chlamydiia bacterium]
MEEIFGHIERITFHNEENGFTVAKLKEPRKKDLTCIVGSLPGLQVGETVHCKGTWKRDLAYGLQFLVSTWDVKLPADAGAIEKYLSSGLIKGIGPAYAKRIVARFGADTLNVIDTSPERLTEVDGLGPKRLERIRRCWEEQKAIRQVMIFLQSYGVSPSYAQKIYRAYGDDAMERVKDNPYCLARDIHGIGFKRSDQIAEKLGISKDSPKRIEAGIEYVLSELSNDGHVCYPLDAFLTAAKQMLEVEEPPVMERAKALEAASRVALEQLDCDGVPRTFIWLRPLYLTEHGIGRQLQRLVKAPTGLRGVQVEAATTWVQEQMRMRLATEQIAAVQRAVTDKVLIITGGPGTGKSTITKAILAITAKLTSKIVLAAPTGRAAKRMAEICHRSASTIHSLLEFDFKAGGFKRNRDHPIECDLIVIDEASMIDTVLMYSLLKAIPSHARVVFVGDIDQLPSVGPGNVLRDMIDSDTLPVCRLEQIFRQGKGSRIILNAHRINRGVFPEINSEPDSDFFFIEREDTEEVLNTLIGVVTQRLPKKYGFNAIDDIQVLAPMRRGPIGIENLNFLLQERLNPKGDQIQRGGHTYRVGDKVMQIRNNYQRDVYNGDVGRIRAIDQDEQQLLVTFDGKDVDYEFGDLDELVLAYAVSIHKYQGSECPCVVMPVHTSHFKMLHRNLLYTGVTRGKSLVVLVGTKKALAIAVRNNEVLRRYTGLQHCLKQADATTALA